ncbi:hypothetical protein DFH08DRAFT_968840 [Mycena albidolilacea]|uniref:Uncharacterized protein n=1 Tax=Mycena albidolilacea TaxID=1033008 RepID=A0AAD6ZIB0_9AGAR|nr:hypothetical protein DFH08DRAFT_968840 [Mycena albidolilacea]
MPCNPIAGPTTSQLQATYSTRHSYSGSNSARRPGTPHPFFDPSRPQRRIAPVSLASRRFCCVPATRCLRACGSAHRLTLMVTTDLPTLSLSLPILGPNYAFYLSPSLPANPIARRRDEAQRPYPSRLPARATLPFALTDDALDAARGVETVHVLGTVPSTRFSRIRFCAPLRAFSLATRRSRAAEIVACPQTHLHRFQTVPSCVRPFSPTHRYFTGCIARHPNVAPLWHPHCPAQSPLSSSHVGGVHRRIADHDIAIRSSNAIHRASMQTHCFIYRSPLSRPSCSPPRDFSAIPPIHDAAASKIVCSRCGRLTRMRAMGDASPTALPPLPTDNTSMVTVPHGQMYVHVRRGTTPTPSRNYTCVAADMAIVNGGHAARMRTGVIRAKEKDEWGRHFHGCSTCGSTTTARSRPEPAQAFPPVSWS